VEHPRCSPRDDEPARPDARREMARERVGVDVQQPAVATDADARDYGDEALADERVEQSRVVRARIGDRNADAAEVDRPTGLVSSGAMRRRDLGEADLRVRA